MRREWRLRSAKDFAETYDEGRSKSNRYLVLYFSRRGNIKEPTKVGFSISRKVGPAVRRNLIKRRLQAVIRENYRRLPSGYRLIFIVRPPAAGINYKILRQSTLDLLKKCNIIK